MKHKTVKMTAEEKEHLDFEIHNIQSGIERRELGYANARDIDALKLDLARKLSLQARCVVVADSSDYAGGDADYGDPDHA